MAKYTIDLGTEFNDQLTEVAKQRGMTKADVIRRAVATYVVLSREAKNGYRVTLTKEGETVQKELIHA